MGNNGGSKHSESIPGRRWIYILGLMLVMTASGEVLGRVSIGFIRLVSLSWFQTIRNISILLLNGSVTVATLVSNNRVEQFLLVHVHPSGNMVHTTMGIRYIPVINIVIPLAALGGRYIQIQIIGLSFD